MQEETTLPPPIKVRNYILHHPACHHAYEVIEVDTPSTLNLYATPLRYTPEMPLPPVVVRYGRVCKRCEDVDALLRKMEGLVIARWEEVFEKMTEGLKWLVVRRDCYGWVEEVD